jgi:hypothetical protein
VVENFTSTYGYLGVTVTATVTSSTQAVYVSATKAMGSTAVGGANSLRLAICRSIGSGLLSDNGSDYLQGLSVPQNTRLPFSLSTRFTGLPPGTYTFGLCGLTNTGGTAGAWNNNEWSRVTVIVAQQ